MPCARNESVSETEFPISLRDLATGSAPLWKLTSMRIGGPARWLVEPHTEKQVKAIVEWSQTNGIPHTILGGGTNMLFPDDGYPGVVIQTRYLDGVKISGKIATVQCGANLTGLSRHFSTIGLSGLEWACGIPGTIGGAVVMNAGTHNGDIASILSSVRILTIEGVKELPAGQLELGYRASAMLTGKLKGVILEATFLLREDEPQHCLRREREILEVRTRTQPTGASSGCIFKNPATGPTAGELLDQAGCKGMKVGQAFVSPQHANFIINKGENNAEDVLELIEQMKSRIVEMLSVELEPEVVIVE